MSGRDPALFVWGRVLSHSRLPPGGLGTPGTELFLETVSTTGWFLACKLTIAKSKAAVAFWVFREVGATCTKVCPEGEDVAHVSLTLPWDSYCWGCGTTVLLPRPAGLPLSPPLSRNGRPSESVCDPGPWLPWVGGPARPVPGCVRKGVSTWAGAGSWAPSVSLLGEEPGPET